MNDLVTGVALLQEESLATTRCEACRLELLIDDSLIVPELLAYAEGPERDKYALTALRIGVLALKQAQGRLDADVIRSESDRLLGMLEDRLGNHQRTVQDQVAGTLREYFDPKSGRFNERVEQFVKSGGELERVLRTQIGASDSELARTLAAHVGEQSTLMKILRPSEKEGILNSLSLEMQKALERQRNAILSEFSLDNGGGALARLVKELNEKHGALAEGLKESVNEVMGEFSLDKPDSALSRLVGQVESAQRKISSEFSLDEQNSALARMKKALEQLIEKSNKENDEFRVACARVARRASGAQGRVVAFDAARTRIRAGGLWLRRRRRAGRRGRRRTHGRMRGPHQGMQGRRRRAHAGAGARGGRFAHRDRSETGRELPACGCARGDRGGAQEPRGRRGTVRVFGAHVRRRDRAARPLWQRHRGRLGLRGRRRPTSFSTPA